ncbi:hypothetical protein HZC27_00045 [Candidatus Roizmanbacteria bacterium]|nr:hypothetical protein [Candidatus Roizmanbacteria bacterium]
MQEPSVTHDAARQREGGTSKRQPFVLRVGQEKTIPFLRTMKAVHGFKAMIGDPDLCLEREKRSKRYGFDADQIILLEQLSSISGLEREAGIELKKIPLTFRYVATTIDKVEDVANEAFLHGGKRQGNPSNGINVADNGKVEEYTEERIRAGNSVVLFVYDKSKLVPMSDEERINEPMMESGWGMKPKDGLELKDTLLGMITIENSQTNWNNDL